MAKLTCPMTPEEMVERLQVQNVALMFAIYDNKSAIAYRKRPDDKWVPLLAKLVGGGWANVYTEISANGQPVWLNDRWLEYKPRQPAKGGAE